MKRNFLLLSLCLICAAHLFAQEFDKKVQEAINALASRISRPLDINIRPMTLAGTDEKSDFSDYLYNKVRMYADEKNPPFKVVETTRAPARNSDPEKGLLSGTYALRKNEIDVFLTLVSDKNGRSLGSHGFTFPLAELIERGISAEAINKEKREELADIFNKAGIDSKNMSQPPLKSNQTNQNINIQAFFDQENMIFKHRDELQLSVMADRNCYFKIYVIEADNQKKLIYPNGIDTQEKNRNYLNANITKDIFENAKYMFYEPYGGITLLIIASTEKFPDIHREYTNPLELITINSLQKAIKGNNRGDLEARINPNISSGAGYAIYNLYLEKPHNEYAYGRPEDMEELYVSIRNDVRSQHGTFVGDNYNPISGFYILNGVRGSFHIPRGTPDKVHFAFYNLDNLTGATRSGIQTRAAGHTFSFTKPGNITQAINKVRTGIEEKGGTFSGNEQQGNFRANGIMGQYQIYNMVEVTITEKPFAIPNSLIEKEVKSFFGER